VKEEFGSGIKFSLDKWPEPDDLSSSESEDEAPSREINLRYTGETIAERQARRDKESGVADGKDAVDSLWLQKQVGQDLLARWLFVNAKSYFWTYNLVVAYET
jgi:hypothetical protein